VSVQSPSDSKSYILNEKLQSVRSWDPSSSIVNVIIESYDLMRNKFPFSKPNPNLSQGMGGVSHSFIFHRGGETLMPKPIIAPGASSTSLNSPSKTTTIITRATIIMSTPTPEQALARMSALVAQMS